MESALILLAGTTYVYQLFQNIFGTEPSIELYDALMDDTTKDALEMFRTPNYPEFEKGIEHLEKLKKYFNGDKERAVERLSSEYTYLLIGPQKLPAPPWESVYLSKERLLFQESTLKVRQAYLKHNFIPAEYPRVADDHLALELDFMANLSRMAEEAYAENNIEKTLELLKDQESFLKEHLLAWMPEFAEKIQESPTLYLYPVMAKMLKEFLEIQLKVIKEITSVISQQNE